MPSRFHWSACAVKLPRSWAARPIARAGTSARNAAGRATRPSPRPCPMMTATGSTPMVPACLLITTSETAMNSLNQQITRGVKAPRGSDVAGRVRRPGSGDVGIPAGPGAGGAASPFRGADFRTVCPFPNAKSRNRPESRPGGLAPRRWHFVPRKPGRPFLVDFKRVFNGVPVHAPSLTPAKSETSAVCPVSPGSLPAGTAPLPQPQ